MTPQVLFDDIPLIRVSDAGQFQDDALIPYVYGDLSEGKVRCSQLAPLEYVVCAHPAEITTVYVEDIKTTAFEPFLKEIAGQSVQCVRLGAAPPAVNSIIKAGVIGIRDKDNNLIDNPGKIITHIAALCGREIRFLNFIDETYLAGYRLAGVVLGKLSLRGQIEEVLTSCGAYWAGDDAYFYGGDTRLPKEVLHSTDATISITASDLCRSIRVGYAWDFSVEESRSYIEVTSKSSLVISQKKVFAKWLRDNRLAEDLARRLLSIYAGEFLKVEATLPGLFRNGQPVAIKTLPIAGTTLIQEATILDVETRITGFLLGQLATDLTVTGFSFGAGPKEEEKVELDFEDGVLTVTIYDDSSRVFPGVFVSLDKGAAQRTNNRGQAFFKTTPGKHILDISAPGFIAISDLPIEVQ